MSRSLPQAFPFRVIFVLCISCAGPDSPAENQVAEFANSAVRTSEINSKSIRELYRVQITEAIALLVICNSLAIVFTPTLVFI